MAERDEVQVDRQAVPATGQADPQAEPAASSPPHAASGAPAPQTARGHEWCIQDLHNKIAHLPKNCGVYLFKDARGTVLYVGKAKDLRSRVSSYFQESADLLAMRGPEIARMAALVRDIDFLDCETEVDALLTESRLIKDIQPPYNERLRDDKTFPYLEITTGDDFPGVYVTRKPRLKGSKLYGPFTSAAGLRDAVNAMQKVFKFRTCELEIEEGDESRRVFPPLPAARHQPVHRPLRGPHHTGAICG